MKVIELDIDKTKNPKQIYDRLLHENPQKGDHFKVLTSLDKESVYVMVTVIVIMIVIVYAMVGGKKNDEEKKSTFGEDILKKLFGRYNSVEEVEKEIEKEGYQVDIEQKKKPEDEKTDWDKYSEKRLAEYFSDEDDISHLVVKDPNPHFRK